MINWLSPNPLGTRQYVVAVMFGVTYEGSSGPYAIVYVRAMSQEKAEEAAVEWFRQAFPEGVEDMYHGEWYGSAFDTNNKKRVHVIREAAA